MARKKKSPKQEKEIRKHHEERRGSMEGWSSEPAIARVDKGAGIVFSMRFSSAELRNLRDRARALKVTLSDLIRQSLFNQDDQTCMISVSISSSPNYALYGNTTCIASSCGSVGITAGFVGPNMGSINAGGFNQAGGLVDNASSMMNQGIAFSSGTNMVGPNIDARYALKFASVQSGSQDRMYVWSAGESFTSESDKTPQMNLGV
jgi:hypothetical protein